MSELKYRLAIDTIDQSDLNALIDWLKTNPNLTQGPLVREFEYLFADWLGVKHTVMVNSGSSANLLAYYALRLTHECNMLVSDKPYGCGQSSHNRVVVPAVSWPTTVAPAIQLGFEPIMCDSEIGTLGIDTDKLELLLIEHNPKIVVIVPVLGVPCQMNEILRLQKKYGFTLIEDACAALGSTFGGRKIGTFGNLSTFSFYFGHHLSTIEGGMICTNDENLYEVLLQIRAHGWAKDMNERSAEQLAAKWKVQEFNKRFTFYLPGFNVRSTDLNAIIGLSQMSKIDKVVERRVANHKLYQQRFRERGMYCQENDNAVISSISFATMATSSEHRTRISDALKLAGIEHRPLGGGNMSRQPFWTRRYGEQPMKVADMVHDTSIHVPNHPSLTEEDVNHICDVILGVK